MGSDDQDRPADSRVPLVERLIQQRDAARRECRRLRLEVMVLASRARRQWRRLRRCSAGGRDGN